jgi:hypothetical protein
MMVVRIRKIVPMGCIYASAISENSETSTSHTLLGLRQRNFLHFHFIESEKRMKGYALDKWESTLNLCVHAHGPDIEPIMEAARKNKYFLGTSSTCTYELILCNRGPDHIFSVTLFPRQVKILVFCRSIHLFNLYLGLPLDIIPLASRDYQGNYITSQEFFINYY